MKRNKNIIAKSCIAAGFYCFNLTSCTKDNNKEDAVVSKAKNDFLEKLKKQNPNLSEDAQKEVLEAFDQAIDSRFNESVKKILKLSDEEIKNVKNFKDLSEEQQEEFVKNFAESFNEKNSSNEGANETDILDSILGDNEVADEDTQDDQDEVSSGDEDSKTGKTDSNDETSDKDQQGPEVKQSIDDVFQSITDKESLANILKNFDRFDSSKGKYLFLKVKVGSEDIYINLKAFSILCEVLNDLYKEEKPKSSNLIPDLSLENLKNSFSKCNANIYDEGFNKYKFDGNSKGFSQIGSSDFFSLNDSNIESLVEYNYLLKMMVNSKNLGFCDKCLDTDKTLTTTCVKNAKGMGTPTRNGWFDNDDNFNFSAGKDENNMEKLIVNFLT